MLGIPTFTGVLSIQAVHLLLVGMVVAGGTNLLIQVCEVIIAVFGGNVPGLEVEPEPKLLISSEVHHIVEGRTTRSIPMIAVNFWIR